MNLSSTMASKVCHKLDKVVLMEEPWDNMLGELRMQMLSRNQELKNQAMNSKKEAERANLECAELKAEIDELKNKIQEEMKKNEETKKKVEASVKVVNLYGQLHHYVLGK